MIKKTLQLLKRTFTKPKGLTLNSVYPVSTWFGEDRGTPIDRYYIEAFLKNNSNLIKGDALEIAESKYITHFGSNITSVNVLHPIAGTPGATLIGDLTKFDTLPSEKFDSFICTQTFNFIYNYKDAIQGAHKLLRPGGLMLATVAGISQVSRYDMDRWGDYWRFTTLSAKMACEEVFGKGNVEVDFYGNCFAAISLLRGIATEEVNTKDLDFRDENYPLIITIKARK
jgi:hypothetical protein